VSATRLVIWFLILRTLASVCRELRLTLSGISGVSITPWRSIKKSGTISSKLSVTNTWLQYNCILSLWGSKELCISGKYKIPLRVNG